MRTPRKLQYFHVISCINVQQPYSIWFGFRQEEEAQLRALVDDNVPQGHEMRAHIVTSLETLLANPGWPYEEKHKFIVRLMGELCGVRLPHLGQKRLARG